MPLEKLTEKVRGKKDAVSGEASEGLEPAVTDKMPVVPYKVLYADLPFYTDAECSKPVEGFTAAVLLPLEPEGFPARDIVPVRKSYQAGQYLTWQLNKDKVFEECYYRNPETGQVDRTWTMHVEFVGKVISPQAVADDRGRLDKLEALHKPKEEKVN